MKKIFVLITLLFTISFSEDVVIKKFDFCNTDNINEKKERFKEAVDINTKDKVFFNKKYEEVINKKEFNDLLKYVALSFGHGQKDFFIFVDPECKYCRAFAKSAVNKLNDGTYHIILYPLSKHKNAKKMISFILDGKTNEKRYERFKSVLVDETFNPNSFMKHKDSADKYIENVLKLSIEKRVKATPTFYKIDKNKVAKIKWSTFNTCVKEDF